MQLKSGIECFRPGGIFTFDHPVNEYQDRMYVKGCYQIFQFGINSLPQDSALAHRAVLTLHVLSDYRVLIAASFTIFTALLHVVCFGRGTLILIWYQVRLQS